jgi:P22_AR N-terminal domain
MPNAIQGFPFVFYGEVFNAYLADDRQWYLPLQDVCQALSLDVSGQRQRIQRDEALSDFLVNVPLETPYQDTTRIRDVACLNIRRLPYWLGTVEATRVKEEHRKKVILFKREFAEAAWAVFRSDMVPADLLAEMDTNLPPDEREYLEAMDQMRQVRKKLDLLSGKLDEELSRVGAELQDITGRLGTLEASLVGKKIVNPAQARLLQEMIAAVAEAKHAKTKKPKSQCFAEVHEEFKSAFQVHIYSILPEEQLEAATTFLGARWAFYNPGQPLPEIFRGSHQPSLF